MKLAVFTAGVNAGRQAGKKLDIIALACKAFIKRFRIDAGDNGLEPKVNKTPGNPGGIPFP